jgi:hypothetical protein
VLYFAARPGLAGGQKLQREAAALLSFRKEAVLVYRVCMREDLVSASRQWAFVALCSAAHRLAKETKRPVQVYLEPEMEGDRIEERLRNFSRAPTSCLTRVQRERAGLWLQRDP